VSRQPGTLEASSDPAAEGCSGLDCGAWLLCPRRGLQALAVRETGMLAGPRAELQTASIERSARSASHSG